MRKIILILFSASLALYGSSVVSAGPHPEKPHVPPGGPSPDKTQIPAIGQEFVTGIEKGSLTLDLRNAYFKRSYQHPAKSGYADNPDWSQWGQGITANFVSGYISGIFGLDASLMGGLKLKGTHPENAGDELLHKTADGFEYANNYSRVSRLNAKFLLGDEKNNALFRLGLIGVDTSLLADSKNRLLESSFRGASIQSRLDSLNGLQLYGTFVDRIATRSGNRYEELLSVSGKTIDNIQVYGATYVIGDEGNSGDRHIRINGEYANSADYVKHYFGQIDYNFQLDEDIAILAAAQYRGAQKGGGLWDKNLDGFDRHARQTNLNLKASIDKLSVALTYGFTHANNNKSVAVGPASHKLSNRLAVNEHGSGVMWTARQIALFNYDKENVWQVKTGYNFANEGIPGLDIGLTHTKGSDINKATGIKKEKETDLSMVYAFQHPSLKGFSLAVDHAWYNRIGNSSLSPSLRLSDLRAYANYHIAVF